jgi:ParB-like chromosome segregation protein Spo0J
MVMLLDQQYREARQAETIARLRRGLTLRAMQVTGSTQREIAKALGVSQPAVSKQLDSALDPSSVSPETLIEAAGPVLREIAHARGFASRGARTPTLTCSSTPLRERRLATS